MFLGTDRMSHIDIIIIIIGRFKRDFQDLISNLNSDNLHFERLIF